MLELYHLDNHFFWSVVIGGKTPLYAVYQTLWLINYSKPFCNESMTSSKCHSNSIFFIITAFIETPKWLKFPWTHLVFHIYLISIHHWKKNFNNCISIACQGKLLPKFDQWWGPLLGYKSDCFASKLHFSINFLGSCSISTDLGWSGNPPSNCRNQWQGL